MSSVFGALVQLPRALRKVVVLFYVHECSQQDIATFLGIPVTMVNNRLPGLAILFLVLGINLAGDWLRDVPDPRMERGV